MKPLTVLIAHKLIRVQSSLEASGALVASSRGRQKSLTSRVIALLVESAAIYSLNGLMYLVLYSVQQVPETWFSGMVSCSFKFGRTLL